MPRDEAVRVVNTLREQIRAPIREEPVLLA